MSIPVYLGIGGPEIGTAYVYEKNGDWIATMHIDPGVIPEGAPTALSVYVA